MEIRFGVTFDRNIEDGDYIIPGGYEVKIGDRVIPFDFKESSMSFDKDDGRKAHFFCHNLDFDSFPKSRKLKYQDAVEAITDLTECFVYTAKGENEGQGLKVVSLDYFNLFDECWNKVIFLSNEIIESWNKKLASGN